MTTRLSPDRSGWLVTSVGALAAVLLIGGVRAGGAEPVAASDERKEPGKGFCCARWSRAKDARGRPVRHGKGCRWTEDANACTAGRELPGGVQGTWISCVGATVVPERLPDGTLSRQTSVVRDCTPY
jgi:hypothetical protein